MYSVYHCGSKYPCVASTFTFLHDSLTTEFVFYYLKTKQKYKSSWYLDDIVIIVFSTLESMYI